MTVRFLVSGAVQGVGFRAFARRAGRELGLVGYAKNLTGGGVEVVARGAPVAIDRLEAILRQGPSLASVTSLTHFEISDDLELGNRFEIW